ncbi:TerB family tellurite resistance protein [Elusimicrobiota bacterium]
MISALSKFLKKTVKRANDEQLVNKPVKLPDKLSELGAEKKERLEELVILGILLNTVAHADQVLDPAEEKAIQRILATRGKITKEETGLVIAAAHESADARPDIQGFTREINKKPYEERLRVIELLFDVAFADSKLDIVEIEQIRQISGLLWVTHKDFINAKIKAKKSK